jgi:hypothetical protein
MELIYCYSRKEAIEDGFQVVINAKLLKEAGIKYPAFATSKVFDRYIKEDPALFCQSETGRIWDILTMFVYFVKNMKNDNPLLEFEFISSVPKGAKLLKNEKLLDAHDPDIDLIEVKLHSLLGPMDFDDDSPAITFMMPHEN